MLTINKYFSGNVASIGLETAKAPATPGVMAPGEYEFGTNKRETMKVITGALTVLLPGATEWQTFNEGESFVIEANNSFHLKVDVDTGYLCLYE